MYALALPIGIVAGLRTLTAPAGITWAAWPAAFIEDGIAIGGAWSIVRALP